MACSCQDFYSLLLLIQCALSIIAPNHSLHWASFDRHNKRDSDLSAATEQYDFLIEQEYSWQRLQANKYGLPKCAEKNNQCRRIGIIGAGKVLFFDRFVRLEIFLFCDSIFAYFLKKIHEDHHFRRRWWFISIHLSIILRTFVFLLFM